MRNPADLPSRSFSPGRVGGSDDILFQVRKNASDYCGLIVLRQGEESLGKNCYDRFSFGFDHCELVELMNSVQVRH